MKKVMKYLGSTGIDMEEKFNMAVFFRFREI
jgi:hypothetical protein